MIMENDNQILTGLRHIAKQLEDLKNTETPRSYPPLAWDTQSNEIDLISASLVNFQAKLTGFGLDSKGYNFKYASYPAIRAHVKPFLAEQSLAVKHTEDWQDGMMMIITTLHHSSGQWMRGRAPLFLPSRKEVPNNKEYYQEYGKAVSYVKRYALENILGIKGDKEDYDHER